MTEGSILWSPSDDFKNNSNMRRYMDWLAHNKQLRFDSYDTLWKWSVDHIDDFWQTICEFFDVKFSVPYSAVLGKREMPGVEWFPGAMLNYVDQIFRFPASAKPAIIFQSETRGKNSEVRTPNPESAHLPFESLSWRELHERVTSVAEALSAMGVKQGDRVAAFVPNMPEAVIAFLATASLGAVWSSCSPDMGATAVLDRFKQIEPKILFAIDGYIYNGKPNDRREVVEEMIGSLPALTHVVWIDYLHSEELGVGSVEWTVSSNQSAAGGEPLHVAWNTLLTIHASRFTTNKPSHTPNDPLSTPHVSHRTFHTQQVPFNHPLWILYSSGTTGMPKPIVQSHGGILLEHLKSISLHCDLGEDDRMFWFTTTGWMMWNFVLGALLVGGTILLYDGSPGLDDLRVLWQFAERAGMTMFGTSAAYIGACMKTGVKPSDFDLSKLRSIGSTGSPLSVEGFAWIYENVKRDVWLVSISGGTDVCTAFVGGCPLRPVYTAEIQCRCLGAKVEAWNDAGQPVIDDVGELVVTEPMPSMPIYFWNDDGMKRYRESYFEMFPGVWRHGDWIKITPRDGLIIYGRSDSTINRQGVRIGTSEIYRVVESVPEVLDSLIIDLEVLGRQSYMPLFVVLRDGVSLDDALKKKIRDEIRSHLSARQLPDDILAISEVPRTLNGKKMEVPIKKILLGTPVEKAVTLGSMANPNALSFFVEMATRIKVQS
jgi:acetoacetyl-CoA synthetase